MWNSTSVVKRCQLKKEEPTQRQAKVMKGVNRLCQHVQYKRGNVMICKVKLNRNPKNKRAVIPSSMYAAVEHNNEYFFQ